jgi:hypothetical protein
MAADSGDDDGGSWRCRLRLAVAAVTALVAAPQWRRQLGCGGGSSVDGG